MIDVDIQQAINDVWEHDDPIKAGLVVWMLHRWKATGKGVYMDLALMMCDDYGIAISDALAYQAVKAARRRLQFQGKRQGTVKQAMKDLSLWHGITRMAAFIAAEPNTSVEIAAERACKGFYGLKVSVDTLADYWKRRLSSTEIAALNEYWRRRVTSKGSDEEDFGLLMAGILKPR